MSSANSQGGFPSPGSAEWFGLDFKGTPCAKSPPMSNPKSQKTPPPAKSTTSSTAESVAAPDALTALQKLLAPVLEFHQAVEAASAEDIRFLWDIQIISGSNTVFGRVSGSSTLPGLLSDSQLHTITEKVGKEMIAKIVDPVTGKFQSLANQRGLALTDADTYADTPAPSARVFPIEDMALEAEIISNQSLPG
jgi:hypothetical protein